MISWSNAAKYKPWHHIYLSTCKSFHEFCNFPNFMKLFPPYLVDVLMILWHWCMQTGSSEAATGRPTDTTNYLTKAFWMVFLSFGVWIFVGYFTIVMLLPIWNCGVGYYDFWQPSYLFLVSIFFKDINYVKESLHSPYIYNSILNIFQLYR